MNSKIRLRDNLVGKEPVSSVRDVVWSYSGFIFLDLDLLQERLVAAVKKVKQRMRLQALRIPADGMVWLHAIASTWKGWVCQWQHTLLFLAPAAASSSGQHLFSPPTRMRVRHGRPWMRWRRESGSASKGFFSQDSYLVGGGVHSKDVKLLLAISPHNSITKSHDYG
ncbi:uncharacterized protein BJX67DRAFT_157613 [Aspergillus lucknowensis]|uniref:Uncharacterized protein n=1 Tax=Aspergillus lucknowensis TaxID=176173 RepID=A0ABR4LP38_9EURO